MVLYVWKWLSRCGYGFLGVKWFSRCGNGALGVELVFSRCEMILYCKCRNGFQDVEMVLCLWWKLFSRSEMVLWLWKWFL